MSTTEAPDGQRTLEEFLNQQRDGSDGGTLVKETSDRCEAIADSTGERCQHETVDPFPYCNLHLDLLDEVDLQRMT